MSGVVAQPQGLVQGARPDDPRQGLGGRRRRDPPAADGQQGLEQDRQRGFNVTEQGIIIIGKGETFDAPGVK